MVDILQLVVKTCFLPLAAIKNVTRYSLLSLSLSVLGKAHGLYLRHVEAFENVVSTIMLKNSEVEITSCARGDTICPRISSPLWAPKRSRAAEETQRSITFPRRIRSFADRIAAALRVKAALSKAVW